ncbi:MAG: cytochrome c oxidase subunit II [Candidatus Methylomirabilota bacterium]|nr:cytochrome c oxidase subunit II [candidate division NC10 bacterium]PWB42412.1 MAG: cytochrome c oxidase subunit II [candidate division NC10 bacterium]
MERPGSVPLLRWLPENVSTYGQEIDRLFYLIYYITGTIFLLVAGTMAAFLILYRHRDGRRATYSHGNITLEIIWTVIPAIILIVLSLMSRATWGDIKAHQPPPDVRVRVTAKQFNWEILYPGPDGQFDTADDFQIDNELHVPVNKVIQVSIRSKDVIHSFFLPNLRLKQDAVPGREIAAWFAATKPGLYEIPCAELCGFGHSGMLGHLTVHTADEYDTWVKEQWPGS